MGLCSWKLLVLSCFPTPWSSQPDRVMDWPLGVLVTAPNGWHHLAEWGHCPRACCRHPESTTKPPAFIPHIHWSKSQKWGYNICEDFLLWHKYFYLPVYSPFVNKWFASISRKWSEFLRVITVKWDPWPCASIPPVHGSRQWQQGNRQSMQDHSRNVILSKSCERGTILMKDTGSSWRKLISGARAMQSLPLIFALIFVVFVSQ